MLNGTFRVRGVPSRVPKRDRQNGASLNRPRVARVQQGIEVAGTFRGGHLLELLVNQFLVGGPLRTMDYPKGTRQVVLPEHASHNVGQFLRRFVVHETVVDGPLSRVEVNDFGR